MFPFSKERRHPAVILSNDETCQNGDIEEVNALLCTTAKVNRGPKPTEEVLDESDGLNWKTLVRCDKIHLLPKAQFDDKKGSQPDVLEWGQFQGLLVTKNDGGLE